jgi:hypothetical protein
VCIVRLRANSFQVTDVFDARAARTEAYTRWGAQPPASASVRRNRWTWGPDHARTKEVAVINT